LLYLDEDVEEKWNYAIWADSSPDIEDLKESLNLLVKDEQ